MKPDRNTLNRPGSPEFTLVPYLVFLGLAVPQRFQSPPIFARIEAGSVAISPSSSGCRYRRGDEFGDLALKLSPNDV